MQVLILNSNSQELPEGMESGPLNGITTPVVRPPRVRSLNFEATPLLPRC